MNKLLTLRKVNCLRTVETIELGCFSKEEFTTELHGVTQRGKNLKLRVLCG